MRLINGPRIDLSKRPLPTKCVTSSDCMSLCHRLQHPDRGLDDSEMSTSELRVKLFLKIRDIFR